MPEGQENDKNFLTIRRELALEGLLHRISQPDLKSPTKLQGYQIKKYASRGAVGGWVGILSAAPIRAWTLSPHFR